MEQLFRSVSAEPGLAFVVVTHQAHSHTSALVEILSRAAPIPVRPILDGAEPEANIIYVLQPDHVVQIASGKFKLQPWPTQGNTRPIDVFFASLAQDKGELA